MKIEYKPIGYVKSPFKNIEETPNPAHYGKDVEGQIEIIPEYKLGLNDLEGFSHLVVICHFHLSI